MPTLDLQRALSIPVVPARSAFLAILNEIAQGRGDWEEFALYLNLKSLGLPDVGYVAIPVTLSGLREEHGERDQVHFTIRARRSSQLFPQLNAVAGIDSTGPSSSLLWLGGTYDTPLHTFGRLFDDTLARGAAEKSLNNMLTQLADAVVARVEKREFANARYRMVFNAGD